MDWLLRLSEEVAAQRPCALVTVTAAPDNHVDCVGRKWLVGPEGGLAGGLGDSEWEARALELAQLQLRKGRPLSAEVGVVAGRIRLYVEPYRPDPVLVVVGAGHVAQPVAAMGKLVGFRVVVIDDRPNFANRERFPTADAVACDDFLPALDRLDLGPAHHVVLVTRGHKHDLECLRHIIHQPLAYVGMIGSRTRVAGVFERLRQEGVSEASITRVYSPIGMDLGAETPAEIAVSVIAELVMLRRGGEGGSLSHNRRTIVHGFRRTRGRGDVDKE